MININSMKSLIYLIRHARSVYNQAESSLEQKLKELKQPEMQKTEQYLQMKFAKDYEDCDITQRGYSQCQKCRQKMKDIELDLIIVSPLRRALSTCARVFQDHKSKAPIIVDPLFREILQSICDIGCNLRESMIHYPDFDYSLIQNPDTWYISSMSNQKQRTRILEKLKNSNQDETNKLAKQLMLQYLQDLWKRRQANHDIKLQALSPVELQKEKLKLLCQKYKSIAIVTHSQNIKSYTGIKPPNCSIMIYKPEYFDKPVKDIPHQFL